MNNCIPPGGTEEVTGDYQDSGEMPIAHENPKQDYR
jgi:hypothetical protein